MITQLDVISFIVYLTANHTALEGTAVPALITVQVIPDPGLVGVPNEDSKPAEVVYCLSEEVKPTSPDVDYQV